MAFYQTMKNLTPILFLLMPLYANAQQNLFNIPSGDITPRAKLFYQHQVNMYGPKSLESKSHLVIGLGKNWDAGINLVDLPLQLQPLSVSFNDNRSLKPLYPLLMFTLQKQIHLHDNLKLNIGTQAGPNVSFRTSPIRMAYFNYALLRGNVRKVVNWVVGSYHTNNTFVGQERQHVGLLLGYEIPVTRKISLMGDLISGNHKKAQTTIGGLYTINKRVQLCAAALLDYPHGGRNHGLVLELNVFGWDFSSNH